MRTRDSDFAALLEMNGFINPETPMQNVLIRRFPMTNVLSPTMLCSNFRRIWATDFVALIGNKGFINPKTPMQIAFQTRFAEATVSKS